jgi:CheY-like chemotaxis protein
MEVSASARPLVLVIDDEPTVRLLLERAFPLSGLRVLTAPNGPDGLQLFQQYSDERPVVLCDVQMPGMDGPEVLAALQALDPRVRLCFVTGFSHLYTPQALLAAGALRVFEKPFHLDELCAEIKRIALDQG